MEFTLPMAVAFVGSVATMCVSIITILKMRKNGDHVKSSEFHELKQSNAVQQEQINDLKDSVSRLQDNFDKLNDLLIQLLTN